MLNLILAGLARPFFTFILAGLICLPARFALIRYMPECQAKQILLFNIQNPKGSTKRRFAIRAIALVAAYAIIFSLILWLIHRPG